MQYPTLPTAFPWSEFSGGIQSAGLPNNPALWVRAKCPPAQVAFEKRACLLHQDRADRRTVQTGVIDSVFERAELGGGVIFFDHIDNGQPIGCFSGNRESHGVRGTAAREAIATAAGVTEVAPFLLMVIMMTFGEIRRGRVAGSAKKIA